MPERGGVRRFVILLCSTVVGGAVGSIVIPWGMVVSFDPDYFPGGAVIIGLLGAFVGFWVGLSLTVYLSQAVWRNREPPIPEVCFYTATSFSISALAAGYALLWLASRKL